MKKITYLGLGVLALIIILIVAAGIYKFNFTNSGDVLPTQNTVWGTPEIGDLNGDGRPDKAVWLVENPGGSGTFFYAQLLINNGNGYTPTNTVFLGDRIAPQNINITDGLAVYNFAERLASEPMTAKPSVGKSTWLNYEQKTNQIIGSINSNIFVSSPVPNTVITSPLVVKGEAKGGWYFEGSFPVTLTNWDGEIIAQGVAQAQGEWMTPNFVPFTATLNFTKPSYGQNGFLILKKDNPSDLRQFDDLLEIPVSF